MSWRDFGYKKSRSASVCSVTDKLPEVPERGSITESCREEEIIAAVWMRETETALVLNDAVYRPAVAPGQASHYSALVKIIHPNTAV